MRHWPAALVTLAVGLILWHLLVPAAYGAPLGIRKLQLSNSIASGVSIYDLSFDLSTAGQLGSISVQFCSNSPSYIDPCAVPTGLSFTNAVLSNQSGEVGFTKSSSTTASRLVLTRPVQPSTVGTVRYTLDNVINPNTIGAYFARIQTFSTSDTSGPFSDYGAITIAINNDLSISAEVPPYLIFCTAISFPSLNCSSAVGDSINFGELNATRPSVGTSQILSSTNAKSGYNITLSGTTLTSGNNVITPIASADVSRPGTPQFGLNLRANVSPASGSDPNGPGNGAPISNYSLPNFFQFVPGDKLISAAKPDEMRRYTASYIVNVPKSQAPGVYVSTVTYICLGNF